MATDGVRRRGRPRDAEQCRQRREQILAAATRHFAPCGYHGMDVQRLADELGTGKGTIYRQFASKEALFLATVDRAMRLLTEAVEQARAATDDPLEQLARAVAAYLKFFDAHPEFVELFMLERAVFRDRKTPTYFEYRERSAARWGALLNRLMAEGRVRRMPINAIRDVINAALYGTMFTNFFAGRQVPLQTQARRILQIVFHGILTPANCEHCRTRPGSRHSARPAREAVFNPAGVPRSGFKSK